MASDNFISKLNCSGEGLDCQLCLAVCSHKIQDTFDTHYWQSARVYWEQSCDISITMKLHNTGNFQDKTLFLGQTLTFLSMHYPT